MPLPETPPDLVALFVAPLNALGIRYMVTGAVAATIYGEPRLTNDIDLVIALSAADAGGLAAAFDPAEFYVPPVEVIAAEVRRPEHGHFNVIHSATALKADFYPSGADSLHRWALARRHTFVVGGVDVSVAPAEYVIIRKLEYLRDSGSDKHARDIRAMLRELGDRLDQQLLLGELGQRKLTALWHKVSDAGD